MTYLPALIATVLRHRTPAPEVLPSTTFAELAISELDRAGIRQCVEDRWHIEIPAAEMHAWASVADVARCVADRMEVVLWPAS